MSTTDSFLPDPDRRIRDSDQELAHEVAGDGPDVLFPDDSGQPPSDEEAPPLEPNPLFRTPHPGERLTAEQLEADLSDGEPGR
jgi:hypothetical protein